MQNAVQKGDSITVPAPRNVNAGDGVLIGNLFGLAVTTEVSGADVALVTEGVFDIAKTAGQAVSLGALVYWDDTNHLATTTATSNKRIGVCTSAALAGDATVRVRLDTTI